jgi:hypothetical protein
MASGLECTVGELDSPVQHPIGRFRVALLERAEDNAANGDAFVLAGRQQRWYAQLLRQGEDLIVRASGRQARGRLDNAVGYREVRRSSLDATL